MVPNLANVTLNRAQILATSATDGLNQNQTTQVAQNAINNKTPAANITSKSPAVTKELPKEAAPVKQKTAEIAQEKINPTPVEKAPSYYVNGWRGALNLQNAEALAAAKAKASTSSLLAVVKEHGWENLFRYELLSPKIVKIGFQNRANTLNINEIIAFYKEANVALEKVKATDPSANRFEIPAPKLWKNVFDTESKILQCDEVIASYAIQDLKKYEIITDSQAQILETAAARKQSFNARHIELERTFEKRVEEYKTTIYDKTGQVAKSTYLSHPVHEELKALEKEDAENET